MEQKEYLALTKELYDRVFSAFEDEDPDEIEADYNLDSISILFSNGKKFIINRQPPVQQIWLAAGLKGYHFNYESDKTQWICDKTGEEFYQILSSGISEIVKRTIQV